jgi:single-strand DNA-binding protein
VRWRSYRPVFRAQATVSQAFSTIAPGRPLRSPEAGMLVAQEVVRVSAQKSRPEELNEVVLVGRMSAPAQNQVLPSGSELWKFRVIVGRPPSPASRATVDTLDCVVWQRRAARSVARWQGDDVVEVKGSLRRRFFAPAGGGRASRCEVEVTSARLIRRAAG